AAYSDAFPPIPSGKRRNARQQYPSGKIRNNTPGGRQSQTAPQSIRHQKNKPPPRASS
ncbi:hypothetical protein M785_00385, partial [Neisseria gonorrhoeae MU_NG20]